MSGVNKVILLGRLGKDPESKKVGEATVTNFSIATSESFKDKTTGEKKEITDWHNIVAWRGVGDIAAKYLHKGDMVYIEGKLKTRSWEKDGVTRYVTEVICDNLVLLGGNKQQQNTSGGNTQAAPVNDNAFTSSESNDELPF